MRSSDICRVLSEDPDLAEDLEPGRRRRATEECLACVRRIDPGRWQAPDPDAIPAGIGLLVLDGLLIRRVGIDGRFGAELLGEGDLLRPWSVDREAPTLATTTGWRVLQPLRVAVLDDAAARRFAAYPELTGRLVERALWRSRNLALNMAIVHQARVITRVHMMLWHLSDRWGRVRSEGVALPLELTHAVLADLVAARRPTVTTALTELARRGVVRSIDPGWLLCGDPPGELLEIGEVGVGAGH